MAITIRQAPSTPNMANNNLVYAVTSNSSSAPQYQFVADLTYSGSNTVLQRIKQQPNPNNVGVFDMGSIITNYLESDNNWTTDLISTSSFVSKRFQVKFGEQYGTSASSSVILYTGVGAISGSPAVTASNYFYVINGLVDPNDKINWNWPSGSYYTGSITPNPNVDDFKRQYALTNAPLTQSIQVGEYATLSLINGNFNNSTTSAQDIYTYNFSLYDATGSQLVNTATICKNTTANGGGPRVNEDDTWSSVATNQTSGTQLLTFGTGYQNLIDGGSVGGLFTTYPQWAYYEISFHPPADESIFTENISAWYARVRYVRQGAQCGYDGVRFAWKNEFGVWDYYTFTLQNDKGYSIERASYEQTFVPYSSNYPVPYSKERRGSINYYNKPTQTQVATSNWLTQAEADWLKELFFSANVFQQLDGDFYPTIITSVDLTEKTNPRTQKLFQYTISFQPANQINPRI
jgi:hypothetical protein